MLPIEFPGSKRSDGNWETVLRERSTYGLLVLEELNRFPALFLDLVFISLKRISFKPQKQ